MSERTCESCGTSIETMSIKAKYCSERCKHSTYRAARPKVKANCLECGVEFVVRRGARRCSPKCRAKKVTRNHRLTRLQIQLTCPFCGVEFSTTNRRKRYCSKDCCTRENNRLMLERRGDGTLGKRRVPVHRDLLGKQCTRCREYRLYEDFQKRSTSSDGLFATCAECRRFHWKSARYNITRDEVRRLESITKCQLCGGEIDFRNGSHAIDHCHETQVIRGVLCRTCNVGLGALKDSVDLVMAGAEYLLRNVDVLAMAGQLTQRGI